ncbi:MAG: ribosome recycling factor [Cryobacterium sp.]|nr:ribosome recycling factor [Oligoflexia bacterium]
MPKQIVDKFGVNADKSIASLKNDLAKVRTGRASTALVEPVQVDYYGTPTPLTQVANVTTPDARTIQIAPWEGSMLGAIEKSIHAANLGLTPQSDGKVVRISVPAMTEERRKEMVKLVKKVGEDAKVGIRNSRRESNEEVKQAEKAKTVTEDESKKLQEQIQKKTDEKVAEVDKLITGKEKEIMTI